MTEGSPVRLLIVFAIPMMVGNIFQQFYNIVDSIIVGRLVGSDALAAIGATGSVTFLFFALCNGIGSGGGIITSQYFGRGDTSGVKRCIMNTAYIMTVFPILVGTLAFFLAGPILKLLSTPDAIMADALIYTRIMCIGLLFVSMYNFASAILRALGDSRTPLLFLIFACILNTILDLFFVYNLHMGVKGAGIATVISQFASGVLCLAFAFKTNPYFKMSRNDLKIDPSMMSKTIRLGVPLSLQFSMIAISGMAMQRVVNTFGSMTVAAFTATNRIEQVIHQPYQTLSAALATFVGQNYGAMKKKRMIEGFHKAMLLMTIFTLIMLPVIQLFGGQITSIFVKEADVIEMGAKAMRITSLFYLFLGLIYITRGVLNGIGDALFALINGFVEVLGRLTVPILLTSIPVIGVWGIWWASGIVWALSGITAYMRYRGFYKRIMKTHEE